MEQESSNASLEPEIGTSGDSAMTAVPRIRLSFTGDIALGGPFLEKRKPRGKPLSYPFTPLADTFGETDILVINLEGPLGTSGPPRPGRTALLHNDPAILDWLRLFPQAVCCLANNHMSDYGADALLYTRNLLVQAGIHAVGAGANAAEAAAPVVVEGKGLKIAFLAFTTDEPHVGSVLAADETPGACGLPPLPEAMARIRRLREEADFVVVSLHAGFEYHHYPTAEQVVLTRALVDAGATLVVGHHPHVQQGAHAYRSGYICHSLGNLLLPDNVSSNGRIQYRKRYTRQFAILHADLGSSSSPQVQLIGGQASSHYSLCPFSPGKQKTFLRNIGTISEPLQSPEYRIFWESYRPRRQKALRREALLDAVRKLLFTPLSTLIKSFRIEDILRNLRRLG